MTEKEAQDTQGRILDAAEVAFAENGLAGARVNAIADQAGVNKAMLYYYFKSKDGLYDAVLERVFGEVLALIDARMASVDKDNIGAFLEGYRNVLRSHPMFVRIMVRELADGGERIVPLLGPRMVGAMGTAVSGLAQAQGEGRLNPQVNPMVAMPVLVAPFVVFALANPLLTAATGAPVEALMPLFDHTAEQILLNGLLRTPPEES